MGGKGKAKGPGAVATSKKGAAPKKAFVPVLTREALTSLQDSQDDAFLGSWNPDWFMTGACGWLKKIPLQFIG